MPMISAKATVVTGTASAGQSHVYDYDNGRDRDYGHGQKHSYGQSHGHGPSHDSCLGNRQGYVGRLGYVQNHSRSHGQVYRKPRP